QLSGVFDNIMLAEKLRASLRTRSAYMIAALMPDDAAKTGELRFFDGTVDRTLDLISLQRQLARYLTPASTARMIMAPESPCVEPVFTKCRDLLADSIKSDVSMERISPSYLHDAQQWAAARVEVRSGEVAWHLRLVCPYALALAMTSTKLGFDSDRVSNARMQQ